MPAVKKTSGSYIHAWDWDQSIKKLKTKTTGLDLSLLKNSHEMEISMGGQKKMSPEQRKILGRMLAKKTSDVMEAHRKAMQKRIDLLQSKVDNMKVQTFKSEREKKTALEELVNAAFADICANLREGDAEIEAYMERSIQSYVKGKHHKKKKVKQIIKHSVKVPLAVAAVPLGFVFSFGGITTPLGLVMIKNSANSIKKACDYYKNHHDGVQGLARRVKKNVGILQAKADNMADLATKARNGDDAARKQLKIAKSQMKEDELVGYAIDTFFSVHSKTISHTADLVDKYRRKVNKAKHAALQVGREIEKTREAIKKTQKRVDELAAEIPATRRKFIAHNWDPKEVDKIVSGLEKKRKRKTKYIADMQAQITKMESDIDKTVDFVAKLEDDFDIWAAKIVEFKSQRPKSIARWKRGIKGLGVVTSLLETATSGGYDAVGQLPTAADKVVSAVGYTEQAYDYTVDGVKQLKSMAKG